MGETSGGDRPWQSYHTAYTNAKAGMEGVDKEKVQRIIYEMSKGSKYFENEKRKEAFIKQKIESLCAQRAKLTEKDISHFQMIVNKRILELDGSRDLSKIWLHTDMDAFYAAVETLENPLLKGKPLAVGGMSMICTASYEARKYGVRAAMPGFIARKLCPELIFVPTNFGKYTYYSEKTRNVFSKYDPDYIATSLDEAYLEITEICKQRSISSEEVAAELRNTIYQETGLTCSVGVAPNRMLAKVCSDINKPNGQFILPNDRDAVMTFISSLPIRKVGGIGKVTEQILREVLGISTCTEILQKGALLHALFSHCSTDFFLCVGLGIGGTDAPHQKMRKSISSERTFVATDDESLLFQKLVDLAETLSNDMQKEGLLGRNLTLKLKTASFEVRTRAISLQKYVNSKEDILIYASKLLKAELPVRLRLLGLRLSHFHDDNHNPLGPTQKTLTSFLHISESIPSIINSVHLNSSDVQIMGGGTSSSTNESHGFQCELNDILESNQLFVSNEGIVTSSEIQAEYSNKECQSKCKGKEDMTNIVNFSDRKRAASSRDSSRPFWIDDYICSVCGIEIPTNFIEERQEHLDYHLAQMLQKEECRSLTFSSPLEKSSTKKQKSSSGKQAKYIPIDAFFKKT
ncbi:DNA polymerase kappa-like isoform X1 [Zingiber officinale]|uniref:DNA polymerase kappa-like isoform X1 n=2 Tax=Zingiber officinale TaxID=94328 RepID=UPI001C4A8F1C|nr:DNA polymerase kappa-like isoform X1 [Zingiber officinale]